MNQLIILKLDDPDGSFYHSILSLLSKSKQDIEVVEKTKQNILDISTGLKLHQFERRVYSHNKEIALTRKEYDILLYLLQNINQVLTFTQIYEYVWKEPDYGTGQEVVSHHVRSLRRKLQLKENSSCRISSIRGIGYRFEKV